MIMDALREEHIGDVDMLFLEKNCEDVFAHCSINGSSFLSPVGKKFIETFRLETIAREDVSADLGSLFNKTYREIEILLLSQLSHSNCS
jgi:hypothetical protein